MPFDTTVAPSSQIPSRSGSLGQTAARIGSAVMNALVTLAESSGRMRQIAALQAKSDAELAAMGLRRDDIVHYVFRDHLL